MGKNNIGASQSSTLDGSFGKSEKSKAKKYKIIGLVAIICVLGISINYFNKKYIYTDAIAKNIFIEGIDVSNLTKEEAINYINENITPSDIQLNYDGETNIISLDEIDLKYNTSEVVDEAYNYTKTDSGNISASSATIGKELDIAATKESIYDAIKNKDYKAIDLKVNIKQPKINTEAAKSVNTLLAEFSTKFSSNDSNRVTNIVLSAKATSDVLLMPGEEFSYNNLTGKRTKSNGYKDAPVIINGKLEQDVGGGVCQVSSTLFNSVLYSGLDVTSRRNHSLKSSYVSIGRDAMVSDGGSDFRFKNPYSHPVYIKNTVSNGVITSKIYGNASDKKNISIKVEPYTTGGLDAAKTYIEYRDSNGNVIRTQYISNSVYKNKNN